MAIIAGGENRLAPHKPGDRLAADAPIGDGGVVRLGHLIGESRPLDFILTGRPLGAAKALSIGLVNRIIPDGL